jgi:TRAP-type C4-dicarboxylate transport system substrate-binding protein
LTYPYHIAESFAKAVEEKSKGTLEVKIFLWAARGERDIRRVQLGTTIFRALPGVTGTFVKILNIYNLPFIFKRITL